MVGPQIDNIINVIGPDYLIYNEGAFPRGPETKGNPGYLVKYTLDGRRGFDYPDLVKIVEQKRREHSGCPTQIILNTIDYQDKPAPECYYEGCSNFAELGITIGRGDLIFPFEADIFHLAAEADIIKEECDKLVPDSGLKTKWLDFIGTQYYLQRAPFSRKLCIRYGTEGFYRQVLLDFQNQRYEMLHYVDRITTFHYAWVRPTKYLRMRYEQLVRNSQEYWPTLDQGIQDIIKARSEPRHDIRIRKEPNGPAEAFAIYYGGPHPEEFKEHPCYLETR